MSDGINDTCNCGYCQSRGRGGGAVARSSSATQSPSIFPGVTNGGEGPAPAPATIAKWRATLAIDFDTVLHRYSKGWADGTCYDDPVEGAKEAIRELKSAGYRIVVFTSRSDLYAVRQWLDAWDFYYDEVTNIKPPALAYIDDRGVRFTNWPDILRLFC